MERSFWRTVESSSCTTVLSTGYDMHSATTECMHNRDQILMECADYMECADRVLHCIILFTGIGTRSG